MNKQHYVRLSPEERSMLGAVLRRDQTTAHTQRRARILLLADCNQQGRRLSDVEIGACVGVDHRTVARTRADYATHGLDVAITRRPRNDRRPHKLEGDAEAALVAIACSEPPVGRSRWTLRLLAARLVELDIVDAICAETVRTTLKKTSFVPG
jgi:hypothetical protein